MKNNKLSISGIKKIRGNFSGMSGEIVRGNFIGMSGDTSIETSLSLFNALDYAINALDSKIEIIESLSKDCERLRIELDDALGIIR